jgi:Tfp pilus assembly protein PilV
MKKTLSQKGVGLIEALIARLIFAVVITAVLQLQGNFFKNSSTANARSIAMSIAEEKIEDLRSFQTTKTIGLTNNKFYFAGIASNAGGKCNVFNNGICSDLVLPSGNVIRDNIVFLRNWSVTDFYYKNGVLTTFPNNGVVQKKVIVTVEWTDTDGIYQTASLSTVISKFSGVSSTGLLANNMGGSGEKPQVMYTPSTDTHVTPISVGTDTKRETLVPSSQTVDGYSRTNFIAYTYSGLASGNQLVREEEFQTVACDCLFNGVSGNDLNPSDDNDTSDDATYAAAHHLWNIATDTYLDVAGELVSGKIKGCVKGGGSNCAALPDTLCDTCCKDHHDASTSTFKFDPFRSANDVTLGDHNHYNGTNPVTTGQYLESCRFKRVNGYWRVFQDWNLVKYSVLPLSDLIDTTTKSTYTAYVQAVIDAHLDESKVSGETLNSSPVKPATINHAAFGNYINLSVGDKPEMTARAVYLDYIDSAHLTEIKNKKLAGQDYLLHLPFYELEVAPVSNWLSVEPTIVRVGPYNGAGSSNDLIAGQIEALLNDTNAISITGTIKKSNSGIAALSSAIDYNATTNPDNLVYSDNVNVCTSGSCSPITQCTLPWGGTITNGSSILAYQSATVVFGSNCVNETRSCLGGTLSGSFVNLSCSVLPEIINTCTTTVSGKVNNNSDIIILSVNGSPRSCPVATNKSYVCTPVTTVLSATLSVTSSGSVNNTITLLPICGAKIVNF